MPCHRLVEQQDRRLHAQRAAELDALLDAVGQAADDPLAHRLDLQQVDDLLDELAVSDLLPTRRAEVDERCRHPVLHVHMAPQHEVVEHRHVLEQLDVLKRTRDAEPGDPTRPRPRQLVGARAVVQHDRPLLRSVQAAGAVEQARLARAVGPDHSMDLALADVQRDVLERPHPAEGDADLANGQLELTALQLTAVQVVSIRAGHPASLLEGKLQAHLS
jgi:hypothetical protein